MEEIGDSIPKKKWHFDRVNSKGEAKFKKFTGETVDDVTKFLDELNIKYTVKEGATMIWIYVGEKTCQYYYTTGRWNFVAYKSKRPTNHYHADNIKSLYEKHLKEHIENEERAKNFTDIEDFLSKETRNIHDETCGEWVLSGREFIRSLSRKMVNSLFEKGMLYYHDAEKKFFYVDKFLTKEEGVAKYGEMKEEFGPRGGWRSVTFGDKKFTCGYFKSLSIKDKYDKIKRERE